MRPHYSHSSRENATPSSGTSPLASCKGVPPPGTKLTKVITLTNHNRRKQKKDQPEFEANACNPRQARENACERGMIGLGFAFASHWLRKWREFC